MSKSNDAANTSDTYVPDDDNEKTEEIPDKMETYVETLHKATKTSTKNTHKTLPMPTRYERARIIGVRATQIAQGTEPETDVEGLTTPYDMAVKEFEDGKSPVIIERRLPGGEIIDIRLSNLI